MLYYTVNCKKNIHSKYFNGIIYSLGGTYMAGKILIIMGSDSDLPLLEKTQALLKEFGIAYETRVSSAHRTPDATHKIVTEAEKNNFDLIIAAAGLAAHLPGVCASLTTLPVIGIPVDGGPLNGVDALYSIVQMPPGVPVGTMGIGSSGAKNAAWFAAAILALKYPEVKTKLIEARKKQADEVLAKDAKLNQK